MPDVLLDPSLSPADWQQLSTYLDRAFELEPPAREQWLTDLATTQPGVADTLRRLLARHESLTAEGFLESSPPLLLDNPAAAGRAGTAGEQIGAYTLERPIGRGGMGEVWLASRSDGRFEGRCAIKFLDRLAGSGSFVGRFRHEGRLLARLTHPNIARLIDAGTTADGRHYLALEYVDGEPINRYCEAHSLNIDARVRLFCDVVSAVATAHASLIVHRDLKPTNVLVTREGTVKLLDFGIAKLLTPETESDAKHTHFEEVALTPEYAAPEQLLGEVPSTATDVYQLGMLLYVLLTKCHPLAGSGTRAQRIRAALDGRAAPASELAKGSARSQLRGDLDAILSMALRKDPRERYATAAALREDLMRYLNREPVSARQGATLYQLRKFVQRHRFVVLGSGIAVASLCAALVFAFGQARVAAAERDRAVAMITLNEAVTEFMRTVITEAAASEQPITVNDMLARSERLALADASGNRENRAAILEMLGTYYTAVGDHGRATTLMSRALDLVKNGDRGMRTRLVCAHAIISSMMGESDAAIRAIMQELAHPPPDPRAVMSCLHDRALIAMYYSDAGTALHYAKAAMAHLRAGHEATQSMEASYLSMLAGAYQANGYMREALDHYEQSMRILSTTGFDRSPSSLILRNNWAAASESAGVPTSALRLYDESIRIVAERDPNARSPYYVLLNRGRALAQIGRYREARASYEAALPVVASARAKLAHANLLMMLADMFMDTGDLAAAEKWLNETTVLLGPAEPPDSQPSTRLAFERARFELMSGRVEAARAQLTRIPTSKMSKPLSVDVDVTRAEAEIRAGQPKLAVETARRALDTATSLQGGLPHSRRTGLAWLMLGRALQAEGDAVQARKAFAAAVTHLSNTVDANHPGLAQARQLAM